MRGKYQTIKKRNPYTLPIIIFCVLFSCLLAVPAFGQEAKGLIQIKPLQIGDTIPESLWQTPLQVVNHPDGKDTITLIDYRDRKLIILDFWATWCGSCIKAFPLMDSIKNGFSKDLAVLLINVKQTRDTKQKVESFISSYQGVNGHKLSLTSVVEEVNMRSYFAFKPIPHYVWIKDGKVLAMTSSTEVTFNNVAALLEGNEPVMYMKIDDLKYDRSKPSFWDTNGIPMEGSLLFRSLITGYQRGYYGAGIKKDRNNNPIGMYYFNNSPISLYRIAFGDKMGPYFRNNRIVIETDDKRFAKDRQGEQDVYTNSFCYELNTPNATEESMKERMRRDLVDYFGINPVLEKRLVSCLIIKKIQKMQIGIGKNSNDVMSFSTLIRLLDQISGIPIVSEESIPDFDIVCSIPESFSSESDMIHFLKSLGIETHLERRVLDVVVLRGGMDHG